MGSTILALVALGCGAAAAYLWTALSKVQDGTAKLLERAEKAEAETGKAHERAEQLRRKLERTGDVVAKDDRAQKEAAARLAQSKEEIAKSRSAQKKAEEALSELQTKFRKAETQLEELNTVVAELKGRKKAAPVVEEVIAPPPPAPVPEDPKAIARRAEIEAERALHQVEVEKFRAERDAMREAQQGERLRENLHKLKSEREWMVNELFEMRLSMRILNRKAEDNRRAYIMTMGALDLAEDELYRIKHGRERPEFTPNRAAHVAPAVELVETPDVPDMPLEPDPTFVSDPTPEPVAVEAPVSTAEPVAAEAPPSDAVADAAAQEDAANTGVTDPPSDA